MKVTVTRWRRLHRPRRGRPAAPSGHQTVTTTGRSIPATTSWTFRGFRSALAGCEAIVHLTAKVGLGVDLSDLGGYARDNDPGTAVVLRAAAAESIGRVVLASSMVVYGEGLARRVRQDPDTPGRKERFPRQATSLPGQTINRLTDEIGVTVVTRVLLDHVHHDPAHRRRTPVRQAEPGELVQAAGCQRRRQQRARP